MRLPSAFLTKMEQQLGEDFPLFLQSYEQPRASGLRANRLKITPEALHTFVPFLREPVPWCKDGFYFNEGDTRPAKHPYYYAGLYYIQEPSAMLPADLLQAERRQHVLDLCAAPGGKSVQLAAQLGREGLLVVNDPHPQRAKVLLKNMERYGVVNAVVLNETPERLLQAFSGYFDKILVDAPCSGEGMFRKEPEMAKEWSEEAVAKYASWQAEILSTVPKLLRADGEVVYSTCTFSEEENEWQVEGFLSANPDFELLDMRRLWPHEVRGEGHFAAKMKRISGTHSFASEKRRRQPARHSLSLSNSAHEAIAQFSEQVWQDAKRWQEWLPSGGYIVERAGHILWEWEDLPVLRGLKVLRSGWLLGMVEKGRFRPSPAFALGLPLEAVQAAKQRFELSTKTEEERYLAIRYLRGETIQQEGKVWPKGWHLVSLEGYPLGWAKGAGHWLKNEFPPGWRWEDRDER
jgi:16S rRNA C967 or C1407 C5-methylase (RsmB/RsmF family)/NOL1/NOP2/fmu family ribosome biogenesis protein